MPNHQRLINLLLQILAELGWKPPVGDVIDEIANGGLLTVVQAAAICEVTDQTIYRWIDHAGSLGQSLGKKSTTWLIGTARLAAYLEAHQGGLPARVKAENLLKKYWPSWSRVGGLGQGD